jgi:Raf kinase inhibitor-like YbhB/YbcL family protein
MRMVRGTAALMAIMLATVLHTAPLAQRGEQRGGGGGGQRGAGGGRGAGAPAGAPGAAAPMRLMSNSFIDGGLIPLKYTQAGEQASPQLAWANAPMGTQSFVLHMHDMEGARNKTTEDQLHWLVWNIPADTRGLPEGVPMGDLKDGSHQTSATGNGVYRGPGAPANGPYHHYVFELFALGYEDRCSRQSGGSIRHAGESAGGDSGTRPRQGGVSRVLPASVVTNRSERSNRSDRSSRSDYGEGDWR